MGSNTSPDRWHSGIRMECSRIPNNLSETPFVRLQTFPT